MPIIGYMEAMADGPVCNAEGVSDAGATMFCTLDPGHSGEHIACGPVGGSRAIGRMVPVYARWHSDAAHEATLPAPLAHLDEPGAERPAESE